MDNNQLFVEYYKEWVSIYKEGAIRPITLSKYKMAISWLEKLVPNLKLCDLGVNYICLFDYLFISS